MQMLNEEQLDSLEHLEILDLLENQELVERKVSLVQ